MEKGFYSAMKRRRILFLLVIAFWFLPARTHSQTEKSEKTSPAPASAPLAAFLGRWDLTLRAPDREYPSWLELREEGGQLKADMVGRWGNARPLPKVELSNGRLT